MKTTVNRATVRKSTHTSYEKKGKPFSYFSPSLQKKLTGKIVKEKKGHIWVAFEKRVHKFCKYSNSGVKNVF